MMIQSILPDELAQALQTPHAGEQVWLVGGSVRDHILQRPIRDFDLAVAGAARPLAKRLAQQLGAAYYDLDPARDAGRIVWHNPSEQRVTIDVTRLRGDTIEADLSGRDFTINALALTLEREPRLIDPTGGHHDLRRKILRPCSPTAFLDDPVRGLRAARFSLDLGLSIDRQTLRMIRASAPHLTEVSPERRRDEWMLIMDLAAPGGALELLDRAGVLALEIPELVALKGVEQRLPHHYDVYNHTLAAADHLANLHLLLSGDFDPGGAGQLLQLGRYRAQLTEHLQSEISFGRRARQILILAAVFHDVGKPRVREVDPDGRIRFLGHERHSAELARRWAEAYRLSRDEVERLERIIRLHMRPAWMAARPRLSTREIYRFFRLAGEAGIDVALLSLADFLAKHIPPAPADEWHRWIGVVGKLFGAWFDDRATLLDPPPLLDGRDLMRELSLQPGPQIGRLLEAIREGQALGRIASRDAAISMAQQIVESLEEHEAGHSPNDPELEDQG
jgi:poly(A) polymerase